jgi:hypothetical protein
VRKPSKKKPKPRRKRFVVEATLGPLETEIIAGMFRPGEWYLIDEAGGWVVSELGLHEVAVLYAADERELDRIAENAMDVWEETRPGHRWAFHVSGVVRDRQTGELRRKP